MILGSLFDGVGGWLLAAVHSKIKPIWSAEIEKFPCAVTKKHFPETLQLGDVREIDGGKIPVVDIICAGSPCQNVSIAGKREGLKGEQSRLFFRAVEIVREMRRASGKPKYFVWENVPGILTANGGLDFKTVLEEITESEIPMPKSGRWAGAGMVRGGKSEVCWRILDAQYFGVPQRRRRIFLIADFTGRSAGEILFEREGVSGNIAASGGERKKTAAETASRAEETSWGIGRDAFNQGAGGKFGLSILEEMQPPLTARGAGGCFDKKVVRRLTPLECERLQGLPDNWTLIDDKLCSDAARYKAIGNGMAQPVADWIMKRIVEVIENDECRENDFERREGKKNSD